MPQLGAFFVGFWVGMVLGGLLAGWAVESSYRKHVAQVRALYEKHIAELEATLYLKRRSR